MFVLSSDNCHVTGSHEYPSTDQILLRKQHT